MDHFEDPEIRLLLQPWASVCFSESTTLMAKAWFGDAGYALLLSDLSNMWYESADIEVIQQRSKELNKRLTAHASSFLNRLRSLVCPLLEGQKNSSTSFSCQLSPSALILHVKSELSGLPFYWDFHCSAAPVEMMSRHLVRPLMAMSLVLQCQVQELASLLLQKDAEIEDYRENGAALSRERLKTQPFKEESFLQTFHPQFGRKLSSPLGRISPLDLRRAYVDSIMNKSQRKNKQEVGTLPQACCLGDGHLFTSSLKKLYMAVTQEQARSSCKRHREGDSATCEHLGSQDVSQKAVDLPNEGNKAESQLSTESVENAAAVPSQTQRAQLPVAKSKKKKAKGLFG